MSSEPEVEVSRRDSIGTVTKKVREQIPVLEQMSTENYTELMDQFREIFEEAADTSQQHAQDYVEKAGAIEAALTALADYNRKALEQLHKLIVDAIQEVDNPALLPEVDKVKTSEDLVEKAKLLVATAEKQLEYSKQIGNVARPLTLWRLDASKAVWEAQSALKLAESKLIEAKERTAVNVLAKQPSRLSAVHFTSERSESVEAPAQDLPKKPPIASNSRSQASTPTSRPTSSASVSSEASVDRSNASENEHETAEQKRPPFKFWPKHTYFSPKGEEICYVRAPEDCLRKKNWIRCAFPEAFAPWPTIPGHNEVIGRFVSIRPISKKCSMLPNELWIVGIPHSYNKVGSRETVLFVIEAGQTGTIATQDNALKVKQTDVLQWRDLHTTDVMVDEKHYLEVRLPKLTAVTFAPCARLKRDCAEIGHSGGRLLCLCDPRVSITAPPGAVKCELPFTIQIQHLDYSQMPTLREQNKSLMNDFVTSSPMVFLTCPTKLLFKPITLTMPVPEGHSTNTLTVSPAMMDRMTGDRRADRSVVLEDLQVSKSNTVIVYDGFQKSLILPQLLAGPRKDPFEITLMHKSSEPNDEWKTWAEAKFLNLEGDTASFNLNRIEPCRLMALKMRRVLDPEVLSRIAGVLEQSLSQYLVYFALRQNLKQPQNLCLILAVPDQLEAALQSTAEEGYVEGDKPHGPVFLCEHQHLDISFRSNIRLASAENDDTGKRCNNNLTVTFSSAVVSRHKLTVEAIDPTAQVGLDSYRGFLDIYCMREILTASAPGRVSTTDLTATNLTMRFSLIGPRSRKARFKLTTERTQLARIVVKLPKASLPVSSRNAVSKFDFQPKDVITSKYLRELSKKLPGDTWRRLGIALDLPRARMQAIGGKLASGVEDYAYAMFISWIKTLPLSADRVNLLQHALSSIGRADLVDELRELTTDFVIDGSDNSA